MGVPWGQGATQTKGGLLAERFLGQEGGGRQAAEVAWTENLDTLAPWLWGTERTPEPGRGETH